MRLSARRNGRNRRTSPFAETSGEGLLSEATAVARPGLGNWPSCPPEQLFTSPPEDPLSRVRSGRSCGFDERTARFPKDIEIDLALSCMRQIGEVQCRHADGAD